MLNSLIEFLSGHLAIAGLLAAVITSFFLRITSGLFFKISLVCLIAYGIGYAVGL